MKSMKNSTDFEVLDQRFSVNDTENDFGKLILANFVSVPPIDDLHW